jgi:multimeric flavodoxin WrbA
MSGNKKIVIVNGSPRADGTTTSAFLSGLAEKKLASEGWQVKQVNVRKSLKGDTQPDFAAMRGADALLFVFPLYFFCVPGILMRFLQDYASYCADNPGEAAQKIYAAVNCGFPEPEINMEAVRVIESFSRHTGAEFGFGLCIGCGPMIMQANNAPFMKSLFAGLDGAFLRMAKGEGGDNLMLAPRFPRRLYYMAGNMGWGQMAKTNKLKKKELYRKPYAK